MHLKDPDRQKNDAKADKWRCPGTISFCGGEEVEQPMPDCHHKNALIQAVSMPLFGIIPVISP